MSASVSDTLAIQEQIARVMNMNEETAKFVAEQHKLIAEAAKLKRDRWLAPLVLIATIVGSAITAIVGHFLRGAVG